MKVKTGIKSGGRSLNHNEAQAKGGLKVQTGIKSGESDRIAVNHNEALVRRS